MNVLVAAPLLILTGGAAFGQTAGTTQAMSCNRAAAVVASRGAVVLHTGPTTYDRFVSGSGACAVNQLTEPAWVRTSDRAQCFIGYRCRDTDLDNGR
jgi:hypothetical protein